MQLILDKVIKFIKAPSVREEIRINIQEIVDKNINKIDGGKGLLAQFAFIFANEFDFVNIDEASGAL